MNKIMKTLLYGSDSLTPGETVKDSIEQRNISVTDLGVAFQAVIDDVGAVGLPDSSVPAVYRGTQILADTVASLPLELVNESTGKISAFQPTLLSNPQPAETYHDTMSAIMYSLIFRGNAYLAPVTRDAAGIVESIVVLNPDEVDVSWDRQELFRQYSWRDKQMVADKEIVHISINRYPGALKGLSPVSAARVTMLAAKAEQNLARRLFEDDATPPLAIEVPQNLSKEEAQSVLDGWMEAHQNRKRPTVLSGGITVKQLSINPVDAQFLESRKFTISEVARMLGLPAFYLNADMGGLTYSTTESLSRLFLTTTLNPTYLERIEQAFSRLLPLGEIVKFDTSKLLRADLTTRYAGYQTAIASGWLTINEVRAAEGLEPVKSMNPSAEREF